MSSLRTYSRSDLIRAGLPPRRISAEVASGRLIRARRNVYLVGDAPSDAVRAARVGGRVTCMSLLIMLKVFVHTGRGLHVYMTRGSSRMREPHDRRARLERPRQTRSDVHLHWGPLGTATEQLAAVDVIDALAHSVLCQPPRHAIATIDSALNKALVTRTQLDDMFRMLPAKFAPLLALVDARAQSGPETLVRLMVQSLGCEFDLQVWFADVGRVDLLVDGWFVIECDSELFHSDWNQRKTDLERDLVLASRGIPTLRLPAEVILYRPEQALAAIRGMLTLR